MGRICLAYGRQWFGAFISIEPGKEGELAFEYLLPSSVSEQVASGNYDLLIQKQLGSNGVKLTVGLNFGKTVTSARPGEAPEKHGDSRYDYQTDLRIDREFNIKLK